MGLFARFKSFPTIRKAAAVVAALATLAAPAVAMAGEGGGGHGGSDDYHGCNGHPTLAWRADDNLGVPNEGTVQHVINSMGVDIASVGPYDADAHRAIRQAVTQAVNECNSRFHAAGHSGSAHCRVFAVGIDYMSSHATARHPHGAKFFTGDDAQPFSPQQWSDSFQNIAGHGRVFRHGGGTYRTTSNFEDHHTSINTLVAREANAAKRTIIVIVLDQYEPPTGFKMNVTTNQQSPRGLRIGDTTAVHDKLHVTASGGSYQGSQKASVILHFDGKDYVSPAQVSKTITIHGTGDITSPNFTPHDFGWNEPNRHGWQAGNYWFDVRVGKQGQMDSPVDTPDRQGAESYGLKETPPNKPKKVIEQSHVVSNMIDHTRITTGTGQGTDSPTVFTSQQRIRLTSCAEYSSRQASRPHSHHPTDTNGSKVG
jgi:hypothetical protein